MIATAPASGPTQGVDRTSRRDRVSFARLLWVAPLTIVVAVAVNLLIKFVAVTLDPALARMGQLQAPLVSLTLQGAIGAVVRSRLTMLRCSTATPLDRPVEPDVNTIA